MKLVVGCQDRWLFNDGSQQIAALYVRGGIRVRDLKEFLGTMMPTEYAYSRVADFGVLDQKNERHSNIMPTFERKSVPTRVCWWYLDDYSRVDRAGYYGKEWERIEGVEETGGDTPYASQSEADEWDYYEQPPAPKNWSNRSRGYDGESGAVGLRSEEARDGYDRMHHDQLDEWWNRSHGDDSESGKGGFASDDAEDGHEWNFHDDDPEGWASLV